MMALRLLLGALLAVRGLGLAVMLPPLPSDLEGAYVDRRRSRHLMHVRMHGPKGRVHGSEDGGTTHWQANIEMDSEGMVTVDLSEVHGAKHLSGWLSGSTIEFRDGSKWERLSVKGMTLDGCKAHCE